MPKGTEPVPLEKVPPTGGWRHALSGSRGRSPHQPRQFRLQGEPPSRQEKKRKSESGNGNHEPPRGQGRQGELNRDE